MVLVLRQLVRGTVLGRKRLLGVQEIPSDYLDCISMLPAIARLPVEPSIRISLCTPSRGPCAQLDQGRSAMDCGGQHHQMWLPIGWMMRTSALLLASTAQLDVPQVHVAQALMLKPSAHHSYGECSGSSGSRSSDGSSGSGSSSSSSSSSSGSSNSQHLADVGPAAGASYVLAQPPNTGAAARDRDAAAAMLGADSSAVCAAGQQASGAGADSWQQHNFGVPTPYHSHTKRLAVGIKVGSW